MASDGGQTGSDRLQAIMRAIVDHRDARLLPAVNGQVFPCYAWAKDPLVADLCKKGYGEDEIRLAIRTLVARRWLIDESSQGIPRIVTTELFHSESGRKTNGPSPPDEFRWDAKIAKLPTKPWKVVDYLWRRQDHKATEEDVLAGVWGDNQPRRLNSTVNDANQAFLKAGLGVSLSQKSGYLQLHLPKVAD